MSIKIGIKVEILRGMLKGQKGTVVALNGTTQCTVAMPEHDGHETPLKQHRLRLDCVHPAGKGRKRNEKVTRSDDEVSRVCNIIEERRRKKAKTSRRIKQFLCEFTDGSIPKWLDAARLKGTEALEDWEGEEEVPEIFEPNLVVKEKSEKLAAWLAEAKRPVFLLGAGVSASVLPTFRGKNGLWTKNAHKNTTPQDCVQAIPTFSHRALVALEQAEHVYFCVTQNYDNLSRRSGFPRNKLSELHGNIFVENCDRCGHEYLRDFEVILDDSVDHETGRNCEQEGCTGTLRDNIIHFDEAFPWHELKMANAKFAGADLTIVLGSSLQVEPAASMPFKSKRRHRNPNTPYPRAVIVNLQPTPNDDEADLIIRGKTDDVFQHITKALGVAVNDA